jgi:hypothetical protein
MMTIRYEVNVIPETDLIIDVYLSAGLNRPVENKERISKMESTKMPYR